MRFRPYLLAPLLALVLAAGALADDTGYFVVRLGQDTSAQGGALNLDWDSTRASAAFTVKP